SDVWVLRFKKISDQNSKLWFMFSPYINNITIEPQKTKIYLEGTSSGTLTNLTRNEQTVSPDPNGYIEINVTGSPYYLMANISLSAGLPDLSIGESDIKLSNNSPTEGEIVYINASVRIVNLTFSANITVELLVDNTLQSTRNVTITVGLNNFVVSFPWTAVKGRHNVTIKVSGFNIVKESNETNNIATKDIVVSEKPRGAKGISKEFPWFYAGSGLIIIIAVIVSLLILHRKKKQMDEKKR
ncbi:MAG: CARDB domain-containing protein, partial [Candidatus Thermoplasmatota archaeon]